MPLEFGNDFCTPCEPRARVWHKGNGPRCPIAVIVVDVDLQHIIHLTDTFRKHSTHLSFNECVATSNKVVSALKEARSAHVEISRMEVQDKGGHERKRPNPGDPQSRHEVNACAGLFLYTRLRLSDSRVFSLLQVLAFVFLIPQCFTVIGGQAS